MNPMVGKGPDAGMGLALGDFIFMVGKNQVLAAAVDVQGVVQVAQGHGGALDMPAGAARPPGAIPGGFAGLGALPENEVHGVFLVLVHLDPGAGNHAFQGAVAELAVVPPCG